VQLLDRTERQRTEAFATIQKTTQLAPEFERMPHIRKVAVDEKEISIAEAIVVTVFAVMFVRSRMNGQLPPSTANVAPPPVQQSNARSENASIKSPPVALFVASSEAAEIFPEHS
jgi:hypothetical protein